MSTDPTSELFGPVYARGPAAAAVADRAWLQAMLDVEAALARACAREGLIPGASADAIAEASRVDALDLEAIARDTAKTGTPVLGLVRALRARVPAVAADDVHHGATSQDIVDTAAMLLAQRALDPLLADAAAAADAARELAEAHRDTPMAGRTLLQQALPTTFGLRAAGWMTGIDEARAVLADVRARGLAVQMGGAVGPREPSVARHVAEALGLAEPALPWHANRVRPAALASALGLLAGALAKPARDATLLAQDEIGELREGGGPERGGSSAMAHKRNPVAAVAVLACTGRVPGLVATLLGSMAHEHERAAGAWQAEWGTYTDLLRLTGSAAAWSRELLVGLEADPARMRENLQRLAATGVEGDTGAAAELVDRALRARPAC